MKFVLLCKRYYTHKDLMTDRFGRLFHLPVQLQKNGYNGRIIAANYRPHPAEIQHFEGISFYSIPFSLKWPFSFLYQTYQLVKHYSPDFIIASGDSHFGALGLLLARFAKIPFIFDVYDYYPAFGTNKLPGMKSLYYLALRHADLVICASVPLENHVRLFNPSTILIENGVDLSVFKPLDKTVVREKLKIPLNDTIIGYFGSIEKGWGVEILLEACQILRDTYPNLRLLLAGTLKIPLDFNKPWLNYLGVVSQPDVALLINACQVVVIPYLPNKQVAMSNACKIAEYLACQTPVVVTRVANYADLFAATPAALCEPNQVEDMVRALDAQLKSPQCVEFTQHLTWEHLGRKLAHALISVTCK